MHVYSQISLHFKQYSSKYAFIPWYNIKDILTINIRTEKGEEIAEIGIKMWKVHIFEGNFIQLVELSIQVKIDAIVFVYYIA